MKKFMVVLLAVFMVAGTAAALDFEWKGSYYVKGEYYDNIDHDYLNPSNMAVDEDGNISIDPDIVYGEINEETGQREGGIWETDGDYVDQDGYGEYDHELDMTGKIVINDTTSVNLHWEIQDMAYGRSRNMASDDNLEIRKVWGVHTFGTGTKFEFGRMSGQAWASDFGNDGSDVYRLKFTHPVGFGEVIGILEKKAENGSKAEDAEKNDNDLYILAATAKMGNVNILPFISYENDGSRNTAQDEYVNTLRFDIGADGEFGAFGFEAEFDYQSINYDEDEDSSLGGEDNANVWGLYGKGWFNYGAGKVGLLYAYGSVDDDAAVAYDMEPDFDAGSDLVVDEFSFGADDAIGGSQVFGLFGDYAVSEQLSLDANFVYVLGNDDWITEDISFWELSVGGKYKLTDVVTYSAGLGYGQFSFGSDSVPDEADLDEPDAVLNLWHMFKVSF